MPVLTPTSSESPSNTRNGDSSAFAIRWATRSARARSVTAGSSAANSSPPRRAIVSDFRIAFFRRLATSLNSMSPTR